MRNENNDGGYIEKREASAHLREQFVGVLRAGAHLKLHASGEASDVVLWLKDPTSLAWSDDLTKFPPDDHHRIPFYDVASVDSGKVSDQLQQGLAQWADPEVCFSIGLQSGDTIDFEATAKDERAIIVEGLHMLLHDAMNGGVQNTYQVSQSLRTLMYTHVQ